MVHAALLDGKHQSGTKKTVFDNPFVSGHRLIQELVRRSLSKFDMKPEVARHCLSVPKKEAKSKKRLGAKRLESRSPLGASAGPAYPALAEAHALLIVLLSNSVRARRLGRRL